MTEIIICRICLRNRSGKDGVYLGAIDKRLTEKMEELTLYLIEKDKENKRLNNGLSKLEKRLNEKNKILTMPTNNPHRLTDAFDGLIILITCAQTFTSWPRI